ncbi:MAG TPA: GNAT family N-acetyltransferase [Candidatus Babeliales bacterium]|nr:GNAT family N-acetyltransferase [Candidatus Babeliales bacterium]
MLIKVLIGLLLLSLPIFGSEIATTATSAPEIRFEQKDTLGGGKVELFIGQQTKPIGYALYKKEAKSTAQIFSIRIEHGFRGKGLGTQLLQKTIQFLHALHFTTITVLAQPDVKEYPNINEYSKAVEKLIAWYEKNGFVIVKKYYKHNYIRSADMEYQVKETEEGKKEKESSSSKE